MASCKIEEGHIKWCKRCSMFPANNNKYTYTKNQKHMATYASGNEHRYAKCLHNFQPKVIAALHMCGSVQSEAQ